MTTAAATTSLLLSAPAALAANPQTAPEDSWVSVSGEVTDVTPSTFDLKYDSGNITVEFDDWDADADAYKLVTGDKVTVTGKIDDEGFQKIEVGDRVSVSGRFDNDFLEGYDLVADTIITLSNNG